VTDSSAGSSAGSVDVPPTSPQPVEPPADTLAGAEPTAIEPPDPPVAAETATATEPTDPAAETTEPPATETIEPPATETIEPPATGSPPVVGDFRMALISSVSVDLPNQHPSVVLRESESPRRQLTFSIAFHDAVVLSHALRRISTPRPLTHELLTGILQRFDIDVVAVRLVGRLGSVYFAELDLMGRNGRSVHSCRPSDALTVALLQPVPVPILIDRRLFEQVGDVTPMGATVTPG
jgi:bifunctional DNase/RNase